MPKLCAVPRKVPDIANSLDYDVKQTLDGRYKVTQKGTRAYLMTGTEAEVREAFSKIGRGERPDLLGDLPVPLESQALTVNALRPQDSISIFPANGNIERISQWGRGKFNPLIPGGLSWLTSMRGFMQASEKGGAGKTFSLIWTKTQSAMHDVGIQLAHLQRKALGNKTYEDVMHELNKRYVKLSPEQRLLVTLRREALTKEELVQPGTFLEHGIDPLHVGIADEFAALGVAEDIPVLLRMAATIDQLMSNTKVAIEQTIPQMARQIQDGKLPQELIPVLKSMQDAVTGSAGGELTLDDLFRQLNLPENEIQAIKRLQVLADVEDVNIPAIYRHAVAPKLDPKFKNGREQFESMRGMTPEAKALADEYDTLLREAFSNHSTYSADMLLGGQLPVFRQFVDAGFFPGRYHGEGASTAVNKYTRALESLLEGSSLFSRRVISGHLNPYEMNASVQTNKHIRNLVMRERYDEIANGADIVDELTRIAEVEPRLGNIIQNYMNEMEGIPSDNFKWLTGMVQTTARLMGKTIDDQFAERMIDQLNFLTYAATIPFRAGLLMRNFYQTTLIPAIVGPEAWVHGMKIATGFGEGGYSLDNMRKAMDMAIRAEALKPDILPIHAGSEAIEQMAQIFGNRGPALAKAGLNVKELFDAGFTLYRSADDWGRTVAYFAGRHRVNAHIDDFIRSNRSDGALESFKRKAKIKMFDETIENRFDQLAKAEEWEEMRRFIGKTLADDTHFLYGNASHPVGWNSVPGKLFGQFGTFPIQYTSYLTRGLSRGTLKDKAEFATIHGIANFGVITAGAEIADVDLTSWAFLPSIRYSGGPYADVALNLYQMHGGSDAEKMLARRNLSIMFPSWDHPSSVFVPGSFAVNDIVQSFREGSYARALGFRQSR